MESGSNGQEESPDIIFTVYLFIIWAEWPGCNCNATAWKKAGYKSVKKWYPKGLINLILYIFGKI